MRTRMFWGVGLLATLLLILGRVPAHMQESSSCPATVVEALDTLGNNCGGISRNSACYGFNRVDATFAQSVAEDFFSRPADRADLVALDSIATAPLDEQLNEWGVAVMNVQANVPNSLPGQAVTFILLGDVSVDNAVPAEEAFQPADAPIEVSSNVNANIRSRATTQSNIIGSVKVGDVLAADALSPDRQWLRVVYEERSPGWVRRDLVSTSGDLDSLPVLEADSRTPMQAFYFKTGIGAPSCTESPAMLIVQGPERLSVDITANGADIRIGSTIALRTTEDNLMELLTISGEAEVDGKIIPEGFMTTVALSDDGTEPDGPFTPPKPIDQEELNDLQWLDDIPPEVLDYPIDVPDEEQSARPTAVPVTRQPSTTTTVTPQTPSGPLDCTTFKATSPLDGLSFGWNTFYWDPAPGATSYRLVVIGAGSIEVGAPQTNVQFDLWNVGTAFEMSWYVEALVNGQVGCTSKTVTVPREANPPPFFATWSCGPGRDQVTINYQNAPPGTSSVTIEIYYMELSDTRPVPPRDASVTYDGFYGGGGVVIANPSGASFGLPDMFCQTPS